ncbi:hypothetical protein [Rhodococcoides kroppenstedtii]|uniref:hypothetical protein n=1 Tax=Rhodococcoides kroppenstedtii TaxID=293050 RepID=UPI0028E4CC7E|nr:hypothetical protein [Rhodococcus kroppenstedtii]
MSAPYDYEALWLKAKLFLNHAMDDPELRSFDERALWSSLALESLAKSALARQSPLLIAVPNEEGTNVLIALGLMSGKARFESISAKTLYTRCERAFRPFSKDEALKTAWARNEYLHSAGARFTSLPESAWWPKYWALAYILVSACERDLDDLVGPTRALLVQGYLEQNKQHIEDRCETLISRAKQRRAQYESGSLPERVAKEWQPGADMTAGLSYRTNELCPACGQNGVLEGEEKLEVRHEYEQFSAGDYEVVVTITVGADHFSCEHCGLVLDSYELVEKAGLSDTFDAEGDVDDIVYGDEYGND